MTPQNSSDFSQEEKADIEADQAPGWDAISESLSRLYLGQEPKHYGTLISHRLGGQDPLDGISVWKRMEPMPHWHFVTYGFSELYAKESDDIATSSYGFELTFRLVTEPDATDPPTWALNFLQNLARYVFKSGNVFNDGDWMTANGPIALDRSTRICSMGFAYDPELPAIDTPNGKVAFLQVIGLTADEELAAKQWQTKKLLETFLPHLPLLVTDLDRDSLLNNPTVRQLVDEGTERDGSSSGFLYTDVLTVKEQRRLLRKPVIQVTLGARQIDELIALLPLRLPFNRPFLVAGNNWQLSFVLGEQNSVESENNVLTAQLTLEAVREFAAILRPREGFYELPCFKALQWKVQKTMIKDSQGKIVQTIG